MKKKTVLYTHYNHSVDLSKCDYWKKDKEMMDFYDKMTTNWFRESHRNIEMMDKKHLFISIRLTSIHSCIGPIYYKICPECKEKIYDESRDYSGKSSFKPPKKIKKKPWWKLW